MGILKSRIQNLKSISESPLFRGRVGNDNSPVRFDQVLLGDPLYVRGCHGAETLELGIDAVGIIVEDRVLAERVGSPQSGLRPATSEPAADEFARASLYKSLLHLGVRNTVFLDSLDLGFER